MRIFKLSAIAIMMMFLVSCSNTDKNFSESSPELYHQDIEQLYITPEKAPEHINYSVQRAMWSSYLEYADIMLNKSENDFT